MYLLNTDVLFELFKANPCPYLIKWCTRVSQEHLYISVLSIGSLSQKMLELGDSAKQHALLAWINESLVPWFGKNVLSISPEIAKRWGNCFEKNESVIEELLCATAIEHNLVLVTDRKKILVEGIRFFNPFV